ncbi:MAG: hypothetical protein AAGJ50_02960 [Pseudomonadota bacterium]
MSKDRPETEDFDDADDVLFGGRPLSEVDEDEVVEVSDAADPVIKAGSEAPSQPATLPEANPQGDTDDGDVPEGMTPAALAAVKDERRKRQEASAEIQSLRDELNQMRGRLEAQSNARQPDNQNSGPQIPNPATDPQGYHDYLMAVQQDQLQNAALYMSEAQARATYGTAEVDEAFKIVSSRQDGAQLLAQWKNTSHPWGEMMAWHKQQQALAEIGSDPEAYKQQIREQILAELKGQVPDQSQALQANPKSNLPPRMGGTASAMPTVTETYSMDDADDALWGR